MVEALLTTPHLLPSKFAARAPVRSNANAEFDDRKQRYYLLGLDLPAAGEDVGSPWIRVVHDSGARSSSDCQETGFVRTTQIHVKSHHAAHRADNWLPIRYIAGVAARTTTRDLRPSSQGPIHGRTQILAPPGTLGPHTKVAVCG